MSTKCVKYMLAYILYAMLSWVVLAGLTFADFEYRFGDSWRGLERKGTIRVGESRIHCEQNLGFAVGWGALASVFWPISVPELYLSTGFAPHGIWRDYPWSYCETYPPAPIKVERAMQGNQ